jgi:hypothetical protein
MKTEQTPAYRFGVQALPEGTLRSKFAQMCLQEPELRALSTRIKQAVQDENPCESRVRELWYGDDTTPGFKDDMCRLVGDLSKPAKGWALYGSAAYATAYDYLYYYLMAEREHRAVH